MFLGISAYSLNAVALPRIGYCIIELARPSPTAVAQTRPSLITIGL